MYIIGLIDDEENELTKIRRTIKVNSVSDASTYNFKSYVIPEQNDDAIEKLCADVIADIERKKISALIIDYKIMVKSLKLEGTQILKTINESVPKFPVIILTEKVDESIRADYVDADKVYEKKKFFRLEEEYSKEKVNHIFDSMKKYENQRDRLTLKIDALKNCLSKGNREVIPEIIELEEQLNSFIPIDLASWDKKYNMNKLQEVIDKLEEANRLLENNNEV